MTAQAEGADDVGTDGGRGASGECHHRGAPQLLPEQRKVAIGRSEIMPPFGDAMGFVDGQQPGGHLEALQVEAQTRGALR